MEETQETKKSQNDKTECKYRTVFNHGVIMRDGTRLATITHIPLDEMKRDTIIVRNPYNAIGFFSLIKMMAQGLPFTFNYVVQDVRGRYNSDGIFNPFNETDDTIDTLNWIADQSWSNGRVHFFGPSYLGWVALQAIAHQDKTKAKIASVFVSMTFSNLIDNAILTDGVFNLHHGYPWSILMSGRVQGSLEHLNTPFPEAYDIALSEGVTHQGYPSDLWNMIFDIDYLGSLTIRYCKNKNFSTKATFVASYYDTVCRGTINAFEEVMQIGGVQPNLIIGPWDHNGYINSLDSVGTFKIPNAKANAFQDFANHLSICNDVKTRNEQSIKVYVLRKDEWYEFNNWPLPTTPCEIEFPLDSFQRSIEANYNNPIQTAGGPVWDNHLVKGLSPGPYDQRGVNNRKDVLRIYTDVFQENVVIMGEVKVKVISAASKPSSHITAKLNLVDEEGAEYIINNGICVIEEAREMKERVINLDFTSFEITAGEKLMIELSWSSFPQFEKPRHGQDYVLEFDSKQSPVLCLRILQ